MIQSVLKLPMLEESSLQIRAYTKNLEKNWATKIGTLRSNTFRAIGTTSRKPAVTWKEVHPFHDTGFICRARFVRFDSDSTFQRAFKSASLWILFKKPEAFWINFAFNASRVMGLVAEPATSSTWTVSVRPSSKTAVRLYYLPRQSCASAPNPNYCINIRIGKNYSSWDDQTCFNKWVILALSMSRTLQRFLAFRRPAYGSDPLRPRASRHYLP
jgi:hypothetical protein